MSAKRLASGVWQLAYRCYAGRTGDTWARTFIQFDTAERMASLMCSRKACSSTNMEELHACAPVSMRCSLGAGLRDAVRLVRTWQRCEQLAGVWAFVHQPLPAPAGHDGQAGMGCCVFHHPVCGVVAQVSGLRFFHRVHHLLGLFVAVQQPQPGVLFLGVQKAAQLGQLRVAERGRYHVVPAAETKVIREAADGFGDLDRDGLTGRRNFSLRAGAPSQKRPCKRGRC